LDFDFFIDDRRTGVVGSLDVIDEDTSVEESLSICIACVVMGDVAGEISSMRTLHNKFVDAALLPGLVRPSDDSGVQAGGLELQNEASIRNCHMVDQWGIQDHPVMPLWLDHSSGRNSR
jgi:hypothetical protein